MQLIYNKYLMKGSIKKWICPFALELKKNCRNKKKKTVPKGLQEEVNHWLKYSMMIL
jgi:hypothetical protein